MPRVPPIDHNVKPIDLALAIWGISEGRTHASGSFTCSTSSATTVVTNRLAKVGDVIIVTPQDSAAWTKFQAGAFYIPAVATVGQFTVNHSNDATEGIFSYIIQGE